MKKIILGGVCALLLSLNVAHAQMANDAVSMGAGQLCISAFYMHDSFSQYWEGTLLRSNGNMGTLTMQTIMPMVTLGVFNWLDVIASAAYISAQPSAGTLAGNAGIQDLAVWVKYRAYDQPLGPGNLRILASLGFSAPIGNYVVDYPYALGLGCTDASLRPIIEYQHNSGVYLRAEAAYNERGVSTLNRDYYYTTQAFFSDQVNVPEALDYDFAAGYETADHVWKGELSYDGQHTNGGFDIRRQDPPFPSNQMNFSRVGGYFRYLPEMFNKKIGVYLEGGYVLAGRNVGQTADITAGASYQLGLWNASSK